MISCFRKFCDLFRLSAQERSPAFNIQEPNIFYLLTWERCSSVLGVLSPEIPEHGLQNRMVSPPARKFPFQPIKIYS